MSALEVTDLHVSVGNKEILRGVTLAVSAGEVHVVMGPNGSGKSTLAHALAGRPGYTVTSGAIVVDGVDVTGFAPSERARAGLFLALQQPLEVPGVLLEDVLVAAGLDREVVRARMSEEAARVDLPAALLQRFVNVDLSGESASEPRWFNSVCCGRRSRFSMRWTRDSTSTRSAPSLFASRRRRRSGGVASSPSRTSRGSSRSYPRRAST